MVLDATGETMMQDAPADDGKVTATGNAPRRPLRRCIVTRGTGPKTGLLRCVVAPDGTLVPDAGEILPGRGYWVTAARSVIETALRKRTFEKVAGGGVTVPADRSANCSRSRPRCVSRTVTRRPSATLGWRKRSTSIAR